MSTSELRYARGNIGSLLKEAGIAVRESTEMERGSLYEVEPAQCGGRRALVFDGKEKGVTVAVRADIPEQAALRHETLGSVESLALLGALSLALQGHDAQPHLLGGERGLEAVMVSGRLCEREANPDSVHQELGRLEGIVASLEPALTLSGEALREAVLTRVRPSVAGLVSEMSDGERPMIVPTFDEEARDRMMRQAE